jgi:hypothetical protein
MWSIVEQGDERRGKEMRMEEQSKGKRVKNRGEGRNV